MIRTTTGSTYDLLKDNFLDIQNEYRKRQVQASTGREYTDRSEDVVNASEAATVARQKEDIIQFRENVRNAKGQIISTDNRIQDVVELMKRANELVTSAGNGTQPPEYRMDIAQELNGIIEQVFSISESQYGESYLFGGTQSSLAPFTATRNTEGEITALTANADADTGLKKSQINENTVIDYGVLAAGSDGLFVAAGGVDVVGNLIALRDELAQGNLPADADAAQLTENMDHVIGKLTSNAVKQQWFESQERRLNDTELTQNIQLEDLQGADLAAVMTELSQLQTTYQATMQMIRQTNTLSIINFI